MEKTIEKAELCEKLQKIYPDLGACGINVNATWDDDKKAWVVHLVKGGKALNTYLEDKEVEDCVEGKECVNLALQIGELKRDLNLMPPTRQ